MTEVKLTSGDYRFTGGTLPLDSPTYIERPVDLDLLTHLQNGSFCYILTARQTGKSSLMIRTAARLRKLPDVHVGIVSLDLNGKHVSSEEFFAGIQNDVANKLGIADADTWWEENKQLSACSRFFRFLRYCVLPALTGQIVLFVDEIDQTFNTAYADDLFAAIRGWYNSRAHDKEFQRLTFAVLGSTSPGALISDPRRTPFNIGESLDLRDFEISELQLFSTGLSCDHEKSKLYLNQIYAWTDGHPFFTQNLCNLVARKEEIDVHVDVDEIVQTSLNDDRDPKAKNFANVRANMLAGSSRSKSRRLRLYLRALTDSSVANDPKCTACQELKTFGILKPKGDTELVVRNLIYRHVFDEEWTKAQIPTNWPVVTIVFLSSILLLLPILWYEIVRPNQIASTLSTVVGTEEDDYLRARRDYELLRDTWPGFYYNDAVNLWAATCERRLLSAVQRDKEQFEATSQFSREAWQLARASVKDLEECRELCPSNYKLLERTQLAFADFLEARAVACESHELRDQAILWRLKTVASLSDDVGSGLATAVIDRQTRARKSTSHLLQQDYSRLELTLRPADSLVSFRQMRPTQPMVSYEAGNLIYDSSIGTLSLELPDSAEEQVTDPLSTSRLTPPAGASIISRNTDGQFYVHLYFLSGEKLIPAVDVNVKILRNGILEKEVVTDSTGVFLGERMESGPFEIIAQGGGGFLACSFWLADPAPDRHEIFAGDPRNEMHATITPPLDAAKASKVLNASLFRLNEYDSTIVGTDTGSEQPAKQPDAATAISRDLPSASRYLNRHVGLASDGSLRGRIKPLPGQQFNSGCIVYAIKDGLSVTSTNCSDSGEFVLSNLVPGDYSFVATSDLGYAVFSVHAVESNDSKQTPEDLGVEAMLISKRSIDYVFLDARTVPYARSSEVVFGETLPSGSAVSDTIAGEVAVIGEPIPTGIVAFSSDGSKVVMGRSNGAVQLWNGISGASISREMRHPLPVNAAVFTSDEARLITASGNTAKIWDLQSGESEAMPMQHESYIGLMALSSDGTNLITIAVDYSTGHLNSIVSVWDATTGKKTGKSMRFPGLPIGVQCTRATQRIAVVRQANIPSHNGSVNSCVTVIDLSTGKPIGETIFVRESISSASFANSTDRLLTKSETGDVQQWDLMSGTKVGAKIHLDAPSSAMYSPNDNWILTCDRDGDVRLWSTESVSLSECVFKHTGFVSTAFSPDGSKLLTLDSNEIARIWDLSSIEATTPLLPFVDGILSGKSVPKSDQAVPASSDHVFRVWKSKSISGTPSSFAHVARYWILSSHATGYDAPMLVTAYLDGTFDCRNAWTNELRSHLMHQDGVTTVDADGDGARLLVGDRDGNVKLWDVKTGKQIASPLRHESPIVVVAQAPGGDVVATVTSMGFMRLWTMSSQTRTKTVFGEDLPVSTMEFSPDGSMLVVGTMDGTVQLWNVETGKKIGVTREHGTPIRAVRFSDDGFAYFAFTHSWTHRTEKIKNDFAITQSRNVSPTELNEPTFVMENTFGPRILTPFSTSTNPVRAIDVGFHDWDAEPIEGDANALVLEWQKRLGLAITADGETRIRQSK